MGDFADKLIDLKPVKRMNAAGNIVLVTPIYNTGDIVRVKQGHNWSSYAGRLARIEKAVYCDIDKYKFSDGTFGMYWDMVFIDSDDHLIEYRYDAVELVQRNPYIGLIDWLTVD